MIVNAIQYHRNINFSDYLALEGYSYSGLKERKVEVVTAKMRLGTEVDSYLFTPEDYIPSGEFNPNMIRSIAKSVKDKLGSAWSVLERQLSVTANLCHEGFTMKYKGRLDLGIIGKLVIDLKVSEKLAIEYMGYNEQLTGYCLAINAPVALILQVHPKTFNTTWHPVRRREDWWERQVLINGDVEN
jgi:hypothetical protein